MKTKTKSVCVREHGLSCSYRMRFKQGEYVEFVVANNTEEKRVYLPMDAWDTLVNWYLGSQEPETA